MVGIGLNRAKHWACAAGQYQEKFGNYEWQGLRSQSITIVVPEAMTSEIIAPGTTPIFPGIIPENIRYNLFMAIHMRSTHEKKNGGDSRS